MNSDKTATLADMTETKRAMLHQTRPFTQLEPLLHRIYRLAYLAQLAVNFILRPETRGAYVAVWLENRVLLIRNSYKSTHTLPCGGIVRGESPVQAARRELQEEVGLDLPVGSFRLVWQTVSRAEFKRDRIFLYEVELQELPGDLQPDGREVVWLGFNDVSQALAIPLFAPVRDYLLQTRRCPSGVS